MVRRIIGAPSDSEEEKVQTASDGTYALRVKEGAWDFTFGGEGWSRRVVRAQNVTAGEPVVVDASLEPTVEITGRVVRNGAGVENVMIAALGDEQEIAATTGPVERGAQRGCGRPASLPEPSEF